MQRQKWIQSIQTSFFGIVQQNKIKLAGHAISRHNWQVLKLALDDWLLIPLESVYSESQVYQLLEKYKAIGKYLTSVDISVVLAELEEVYRLLVENEYTLYSQFKAALTPGQRLLLAPMKTKAVRIIDWKEYTIFRDVTTWLRFLSKLEFEMDSLEEEALASFLATEERLAMLNLDTEDEITSGLRTIITRWFKGIDLTYLPVRHGPGSVAEGPLSKYEKYLRLAYDPYLDKCTTGWYSSQKTLQDYYPFKIRSTPVKRISKVRFVPKNAKKLRTICMEPATLQYFQQGLMRKVYDFVKKDPFLYEHIRLDKQEANQELACEGSLKGNFATLDMSAASDSVSWDLVKRIFCRTRLYRWMIATRSTHCELPNGQVIESRKYAPMGSAVCFPTEFIIFAAVIEYVAERRGFMIDSLNIRWLVYGDDCIVPTEWAEEVIDVLQRIGFIINVDKSYLSGPFRESCGEEYYKGYPTTPLYHRLNLSLEKVSPTDFMRLCAGSNLAYAYGYPLVRNRYLERLLNFPKRKHDITRQTYKLLGHLSKKEKHRLFIKSGPLFTDNFSHSPAIFSPMPTNFHLVSKPLELYSDNCVNYQRKENYYLSVTSTAEEIPYQADADRIGYLEFLIEREFNPTPSEEAIECIFSLKSLAEQRLTWLVSSAPI